MRAVGEAHQHPKVTCPVATAVVVPRTTMGRMVLAVVAGQVEPADQAL